MKIFKFFNLKRCWEVGPGKRAKEGDGKAENYLLNKYKNLVRGKAKTLYLLGGDREDLIQEGMIGLFMAVRDFDKNKNASFFDF